MYVYDPPTEPWIRVLRHDRDLLVLDKPSGLLSVPGRQPGWQDSALSRAQRDYPTARASHRLDMDTSGVLVLTLRGKAERNVKAQFAARTTSKVYLAWVWGQPEDSGRIDAPLRRVGGLPPRNVVDTVEGKPALTEFEVISRRADCALLSLRPKTGRSHQLRVHLAHIQHPILGDRLYAHNAALQMASRLQLHAAELSLDHPWSGERLRLRAPCSFLDGPTPS